jgi:hypothetical protein
MKSSRRTILPSCVYEVNRGAGLPITSIFLSF